jgi:hypothetical protein
MRAATRSWRVSEKLRILAANLKARAGRRGTLVVVGPDRLARLRDRGVVGLQVDVVEADEGALPKEPAAVLGGDGPLPAVGGPSDRGDQGLAGEVSDLARVGRLL